jgi:hypothetical protein
MGITELLSPKHELKTIRTDLAHSICNVGICSFICNFLKTFADSLSGIFIWYKREREVH